MLTQARMDLVNGTSEGTRMNGDCAESAAMHRHVRTEWNDIKITARNELLATCFLLGLLLLAVLADVLFVCALHRGASAATEAM